MQANASGVTNPLLKQASTVGAPFWFVLASTTDAARTTRQSASAAQAAAEQDPDDAQNPAAQTETNPDQSADAGIVAQTTIAQDAPLASAVSATAKATAANAALAQGTTRTAAGSSTARRPANNDGASDVSSNSPISNPALPSPTAVLAQFQTTIQQPVTPAVPTIDPVEDVRSSTVSIQSAPLIETTSLAAPVHTTAPIVDQPANATGDMKTPSGESATTKDPSIGVAAFALSPSPKAISERSETTDLAPHQAPPAISAQASPSTPAHATTTATNAVDTKTQNDPVRNGAAVKAISFALSQTLPTGTAPTTASAPQSESSPSTSLPLLPTLSVDSSAFARTMQSTASDAVSTNSASTASTTRAGSVDSTPATADKSTHAQTVTDNQSQSQTVLESTQHTSDPTQPVTGKIADAAQPQAITSHAGLRDAATTDTNRSSDSARASEPARTETPLPADGSETIATSGVNAARLIQTLNETGMHVGMHSAEFGDISIRTLVSQQQMTAQISVDHSDLGRALAANVPTMQTKLGDDLGLRASIQVHQSGASFSGDQSNTSGGQQKAYGAPTQVGSISLAAEVETAGLGTAINEGNRLDIRA
jgi:hypothetical protein